ncbi:MAG: hypothetical protein QOG62_991, partial [Thermoleophilaceae bacterium]|nr:hypothetical protein [Thermoleophilaceae bacterium]
DGLGPDDDDLLTSIAQFDLLSNVVAIGEAQLGHPVPGRVYYPNFARFHQHRIEPAVERLLSDADMRHALFPLGDGELALALVDIDEKARQEGWRFDGFMGWEHTPVGDFISASLPESTPDG